MIGSLDFDLLKDYVRFLQRRTAPDGAVGSMLTACRGGWDCRCNFARNTLPEPELVVVVVWVEDMGVSMWT